MFNKYGDLYIDGRNVDIEKTSIATLNEYLKKLEINKEQLIENQNDELSQIIG